jgi:hypothetical protein
MPPIPTERRDELPVRPPGSWLSRATRTVFVDRTMPYRLQVAVDRTMRRIVPAVTLQQIVDEYAVERCHFLKLDGFVGSSAGHLTATNRATGNAVCRGH